MSAPWLQLECQIVKWWPWPLSQQTNVFEGHKTDPPIASDIDELSRNPQSSCATCHVDDVCLGAQLLNHAGDVYGATTRIDLTRHESEIDARVQRQCDDRLQDVL